jgi:myo-inositol-1(or 4)-monophosphatase
MSHTDIDLQLVETWIKEAGDMALRMRDSLNAASKADGSLVTNVDHQIEEYLYNQILRSYPEHQILAEEGTRLGNNGEYLWTIDPIDGTRAYVSGLPVWGISIGILRRGEPYAGLFFMPMTGELYASVGEKAFYNHRLLSAPAAVDIQDSLAFLAVPSNAHRLYEISYRRLRSLGSTTAHLAYVARGTAVAALTRPLYIWDLAPVLPLLNATGIALVYLSGREFKLQPLLDASRSLEPLIAAPANVIEDIRVQIRSKPSE